MKFSTEPFAKKPSESELRKIKIIPTDEKLTAAAGLGTVIEIFDQSGLKEQFVRCLPKRTSPRSQGSYNLALNMMAGFIHGFDCLEDYDGFKNDEAIKALFGNDSPAARTLGDFLRDFEDEHLERLNEFLGHMAWSMTSSLHKSLPEPYKPNYVCLDIDSTDHPQSGNKMEGVAWNFKNNWCLDSQVVFNQLGFCHGLQLRAGNTKSGVEACSLLDTALLDGKIQVQRKFEGKVFLRGDSAYCQQSVIKKALEKGIHFTLTAHDGTTNWKDQLGEQGLSWTAHVYTAEQLKWAQEKERELPQVDYARMNWTPRWSVIDDKKLVFPIVIKRTLNKERFAEIRRQNSQLRLVGDDGYLKEDPYDYYAIVTNIPLDLASERLQQTEAEKSRQKRYYSLQEICEFHQKRGNAENFVREEKYGYDLSHFPCLKLNANRAYGMLAMVAHNLLRWVSVMMNPDKPHFSKKLRKRFVFYAGKVVHHARQVFLKIVRHGYEEVMKLRETWEFTSEKILPLDSSA